MLSHSVMSDSLQPHELQPARLLCPWGSPGKNTGVGSHSLLQGIFLTQGSNPCLLHWQEDSLPLSHLGSLTAYSSPLKMSDRWCDQIIYCSNWTSLRVKKKLLIITSGTDSQGEQGDVVTLWDCFSDQDIDDSFRLLSYQEAYYEGL